MFILNLNDKGFKILINMSETRIRDIFGFAPKPNAYPLGDSEVIRDCNCGRTTDKK